MTLVFVLKPKCHATLLTTHCAYHVLWPVAYLEDGVELEGAWTALVAGLALGTLEVLSTVLRVGEELAVAVTAGLRAGWKDGTIRQQTTIPIVCAYGAL